LQLIFGLEVRVTVLDVFANVPLWNA